MSRRYYNSNRCQHCSRESFALIMSMFDESMICMSCKDAEKKRPDYKAAERKDLQEYASRLEGLGMTAHAQSVRDVADSIK